ncbi:MAG: hypothetical protein QW812_02895 [Thermoplasmataceae archaeon]
MITIAGGGVSGTYLGLLLKNSGFSVKVFDPARSDRYIPCGYATNYHLMREMLSRINVEFDDYVLSVGKKVTFARDGGREVEFQCDGLCTYDKNRLSRDLNRELGTVASKPGIGTGSTIVDCTGISRYYLGPARSDFTMRTREYLTARSKHEDFYFRYFKNGRGYYWEFPLGGEFHLGAGSDSLDLIDASLKDVAGIRITGRDIRLRLTLDEISKGNVIGCGESIGTVSPITGEGILPSMECSFILFQALSASQDIETVISKYRENLSIKFRRFVLLSRLLEQARNGKLIQLRNVRYIKPALEDLRHFGIRAGVPGLLSALFR